MWPKTHTLKREKGRNRVEKKTLKTLKTFPSIYPFSQQNRKTHTERAPTQRHRGYYVLPTKIALGRPTSLTHRREHARYSILFGAVDRLCSILTPKKQGLGGEGRIKTGSLLLFLPRTPAGTRLGLSQRRRRCPCCPRCSLSRSPSRSAYRAEPPSERGCEGAASAARIGCTPGFRFGFKRETHKHARVHKHIQAHRRRVAG